MLGVWLSRNAVRVSAITRVRIYPGSVELTKSCQETILL